jgi:hypothetical protein
MPSAEPVPAGAPPASFENAVFVSYAHIDDQAMAEGQTGWIATFHRALAVRLAQLLGYEPTIWRDPKLQGNDVFADTLIDRLPRVAVLISVLSPRYVKSEWCLRELNEFVRATGGARVADKLRLFKVVKTPVVRGQMPPSLAPVLGYEFFTVDPQSGRERELEFNPALATPEQQRLYLMKVVDLSHDVADLLALLENGAPAPAASANGPCVYVAETSRDANDRRDAIRRELQARGCTVLPDRPLPLVADECAALVREQLARASLSVHIVGRDYGVVPDRATESIVALQNELAIDRAQAGEFCRLIWMTPDLAIDDPRQQRFVERLESDPRNDARTDILKTPLEDFKSVLHVRLNPSKAISSPGRATDAVRRVYVICDRRDLDQTRPVEDFLFSRGCEAILPVFDGDEAQIRQEHETNLIECDAALIYYGSGGELWLRSKLRELQKIAGYGRTAPLAAKAIYVAPPLTPEKERFRTLEAMVILPGPAGPAALEPLLLKLDGAAVAPAR